MQMRIPALTGALFAVVLLGAPAAQAQTNQPWCSTDKDGAMNCIYSTLSSCEQTMRGEGGVCVRNPRN